MNSKQKMRSGYDGQHGQGALSFSGWRGCVRLSSLASTQQARDTSTLTSPSFLCTRYLCLRRVCSKPSARRELPPLSCFSQIMNKLSRLVVRARPQRCVVVGKYSTTRKRRWFVPLQESKIRARTRHCLDPFFGRTKASPINADLEFPTRHS